MFTLKALQASAHIDRIRGSNPRHFCLMEFLPLRSHCTVYLELQKYSIAFN